jgi:DNA-binding response OmpR family regulator
MQGRLGLELANQNPPDVILLDLHLPDMHGKDVLTALKENRVFRIFRGLGSKFRACGLAA